MFVTGWTGDDVNEYTLSTGFNVSTATFVDSFDVSSQEARPSGVQFDSDGTTMYVLGGHTDPIIYQYTLTTAFDISTASYSGSSFSVLDEESKPRGFCFGDNGTKLFVCGWHGDDINLYTASGSSTAGEENHLMLETASDDQTINHYHLPTGPHHTADDGHTEVEHRELALWNYKLQLLMIQERA
jgi:DNA-binding beta-propeller fold protein YncE